MHEITQSLGHLAIMSPKGTTDLLAVRGISSSLSVKETMSQNSNVNLLELVILQDTIRKLEGLSIQAVLQQQKRRCDAENGMVIKDRYSCEQDDISKWLNGETQSSHESGYIVWLLKGKDCQSRGDMIHPAPITPNLCIRIDTEVSTQIKETNAKISPLTKKLTSNPFPIRKKQN